MLNTFVLIKQVPDPHNLKIDQKTGTLIREGVENIINPDDLYALEFALQIKSNYGGTTHAITMGPPHAVNALRECLAMGIDRAILISDPMFSYSDTLQTTLVLKEAFEHIKNYDLILTGSKTSDSSTGQVPYQLSEALDIPLITDIFSFEIISNKIFKCHRNFGHESQHIQTNLPILIRVQRHYNEPRHIPLGGIKKAYEEKIQVFDFNTFNCPNYLDGCNKSPTAVVKTEQIEIRRKNEEIDGTIQEKIEKLIKIMKEHRIERIWTGRHKHD
ncbi:MAG: electron transfer flavoprotein subunit beta [Candidatus Lokiarchaeota archaeon]|nr:electron transfer flavoprotein subunit beta [Candidatus Lokiarchaeota archaeon]MBD3342647.1 electron transfer flavoprotein subunit beta [Candidatus Lokiarchaeota archaeon]